MNFLFKWNHNEEGMDLLCRWENLHHKLQVNKILGRVQLEIFLQVFGGFISPCIADFDSEAKILV
jgi:hypothetical protein